MTNPTPTRFFDVIQAHERAWGNDTYPNRPSLEQLLSSPVVALWASDEPKESRSTATVHADVAEIEKYAIRMLLHSKSEMPKQRLLAVYINQKRQMIRNISIEFVEAKDT